MFEKKGYKNTTKKYKKLAFIRKNIFRDDYTCLLCQKEVPMVNEYAVCPDCEQNIPFNDGKTCLKCAAPLANEADYCLSCQNHERLFEKAYAPLLFQGSIRQLVLSVKYGVKQYAYFNLAKFLCEEIEKKGIEFDIVAYIPHSKKAAAKRQICLSKKLAETVAGRFDKPLFTGLTSNASDMPRHLLKGIDRIKEFSHLFSLTNKEVLRGKTVLLVDDVITTGTTANSVTIALLKGKPTKVIVLCLCH